MESKLQNKINNSPKKPGCYLWKDLNGEIIYVGKAKNINSRIKQYFLKNSSEKVKLLASKIADLDFIVTNNENEALILERELISKNKPKYNSLLREYGNYPYLIVTDEENPRLIYTKDHAKYSGKKYGPYAKSNSDKTKHELYLLCNRLFPLRKCKNIPKKKCIYYDIGQCLGPCINKIKKDEYLKIKKNIDNFLNGNTKDIKNTLKEKEISFSNELNFEQAKYFFDLQNSIENIFEKSNISISIKSEISVVGYVVRNNIITVVIFTYYDGNIIDSYEESSYVIDDYNDELIKILYNFFCDNKNFKKVFISLDEINLSTLNSVLKNIKFINPETGEFKNILSLAAKNASIKNANINVKKIKKTFTNQNAINELKKIMKIENLTLIEIYDNSNLFNSNKVSAKVAYWDGEKDKTLYRKYNLNENLKSDFEMMKEVIRRRFSNISDGNLPNLIILDGGKIQISAANESLEELGLNNFIKVAGLSKDNYHTTNTLIYNDEEIVLDRKSDLFSFLSEMQEEVHRYVISFYRQKKSKNLFYNSLNEIEGLGKTRIKILLDNFTSLDQIKNSSIDELSQFVPKNIAKKIYDYFKIN